ncbi:MAG: zinc ribbon domain-containing protein [Wenzhouxiangellaceae bacterium]|nr:zinc ribbon domain-containing protein [Wenzhouxiangellaceae bacterium]
MPFYEYIYDCDDDGEENPTRPGCEYCRARFTVLQRLSEPRLESCPNCGAGVRRLISPPHVVSGKAHQLQPSSIEKAGFTQYKKIDKGVYEKTAGKGPAIIKGD